jgi:hypothetical protein
MTSPHLFRLVVALLAAALVLSAGCRQIQLMTFGITVEEAEPGTPEATIQAALRAAMEPDEDKGWAAFESLLHSTQKESPASKNNWRKMNYAKMRTKWKLFVTDIEGPAFHIQREREQTDGGLEIFLENKRSDLPTPCTVEQDFDGAWRITKCSL